MVILLTPALRQIDASFEEAAEMSGAATWGTLCRVTIPLLAPSILTAFVLALIRSLEAFEVERVLGAPVNIDVYSTRIYDFVSLEPPLFAQAMALSVLFLAMLPGAGHPLSALSRAQRRARDRRRARCALAAAAADLVGLARLGDHLRLSLPVAAPAAGRAGPRLLHQALRLLLPARCLDRGALARCFRRHALPPCRSRPRSASASPSG